MAGRGHPAFHPARDYCHLCLLQEPALHRPGHMDAPCPALEPGLGPLPWRGRLPFHFPLELGMAEDQMDNRDRHVPQRRQVYLGPSHCPASEGCSPPWYSWREVSASTWDWPHCVGLAMAPRLSSCTCAWERRRECECTKPWYPTGKPHLFNGGPAPQLLPAKVRGQGYYREARYVAMEHYWDCYSGAHLQGSKWDNLGACGYNGRCERRHVTFESQNDGSECDSAETSRPASPTTTHCNGSWAFFPTEVPQSQFRSCRMPGSRLPVSVVQREDPELGRAVRAEGPGALESRRNQRNQGSVREQIKQVVTELEDVLGGLKQVQLEMREVVQQIDLLTSNIDLKEDPGHHGDCFGVVEIIQDSEGDAESLQQGGVRTTLLQSEGGLAAGTSGRRDLVVACPPAHGPVAKESTDSKRAVATCAQCTNSVANGDCLPARPPKAKVKELWHQRRKTDHVAPSKPPKPPFPLAGLIKTQRPLPCPQNGQVKMALQESNQPPDIMKIPHYPGKQKQFPSTVV